MVNDHLGLLLRVGSDGEVSRKVKKLLGNQEGFEELQYIMFRHKGVGAQIYNQSNNTYFWINEEVIYWLDYLAVLIGTGRSDLKELIEELERVLSKIVPIGLIDEFEGYAFNALCNYKLIH